MIIDIFRFLHKVVGEHQHKNQMHRTPTKAIKQERDGNPNTPPDPTL
ncbi:MAG: hypothetical protein WKF59_01565 [Chitinophagaceae bacterium]